MFFFFIDPATSEIYTLSLHDALPISRFQERGVADLRRPRCAGRGVSQPAARGPLPVPVAGREGGEGDRKSTRLNSSHANISYAVFCLKKKKTERKNRTTRLTRHTAAA